MYPMCIDRLLQPSSLKGKVTSFQDKPMTKARAGQENIEWHVENGLEPNHSF